MHAALFEHQAALADGLMRYAAELGLDVARLGADLAAHAAQIGVRDDFRGGVRSMGNTPPSTSTMSAMTASWESASSWRRSEIPSRPWRRRARSRAAQGLDPPGAVRPHAVRAGVR